MLNIWEKKFLCFFFDDFKLFHGFSYDQYAFFFAVVLLLCLYFIFERFIGSAIPYGADAVVPVEQTELCGKSVNFFFWKNFLALLFYTLLNHLIHFILQADGKLLVKIMVEAKIGQEIRLLLLFLLILMYCLLSSSSPFRNISYLTSVVLSIGYVI